MSNCHNTLNWIPVSKAVQYKGEAGEVVQGIAVTFQISVDATSSIFDWASRSPRKKYSTFFASGLGSVSAGFPDFSLFSRVNIS